MENSKKSKKSKRTAATVSTPERTKQAMDELRRSGAREFAANPNKYIREHLSGLLKSHSKESEEIIAFYSTIFPNFNDEEFKGKIGDDAAVKQSKIDLLQAVAELDDEHKIELLKFLQEGGLLNDLNIVDIVNAMDLDDPKLVLGLMFEDKTFAEYSEEEREGLIPIILTALSSMSDEDRGGFYESLKQDFEGSDHDLSAKLSLLTLIQSMHENRLSFDEKFAEIKDDIAELFLINLTTQAFNSKLSADKQKTIQEIEGLLTSSDETTGFDIKSQQIFKSLQAKSFKEIMEYFKNGLDKNLMDQFKDFIKEILNFFLKLAGREQYNYSASKECTNFAEMISKSQKSQSEEQSL